MYFMSTSDHRQAALRRVQALTSELKSQTGAASLAALVQECEALERAISAFHMEGIRFRMFNVDRLLARSGTEIPEAVRSSFADTRRELEAAGFHTRSHQAPG
jgi:hypothetical protein